MFTNNYARILKGLGDYGPPGIDKERSDWYDRLAQNHIKGKLSGGYHHERTDETREGIPRMHFKSSTGFANGAHRDAHAQNVRNLLDDSHTVSNPKHTNFGTHMVAVNKRNGLVHMITLHG
jgi:hypothetical protein